MAKSSHAWRHPNRSSLSQAKTTLGTLRKSRDQRRVWKQRFPWFFCFLFTHRAKSVAAAKHVQHRWFLQITDPLSGWFVKGKQNKTKHFLFCCLFVFACFFPLGWSRRNLMLAASHYKFVSHTPYWMFPFTLPFTYAGSTSNSTVFQRSTKCLLGSTKDQPST